MTFIIAEVGSNWTSLQDCLDSIVSAKACGADAVKFQMYTHRELYGYDLTEVFQKEPGIQVSVPIEMPGTLPRDLVPQLHAKCQEVGIEFMCTAFSPEGYRFIDPYVKRHKIASAENCDEDILATVKELGKHAFISTGGTTVARLHKISNFFKVPPIGVRDISFLYCVSSYPSKNTDLFGVRMLQEEFEDQDISIGYSCHSDDWMTAALAADDPYHATIIEKHFKIRTMNTPDDPHSIAPKDFKKMVSTIRNGPDVKFPHPDEADFIKYSKRRWIPELNGYYRTKKP